MLAHASGEWIASDWPVCAIAEDFTDPEINVIIAQAEMMGEL
jgi:hypothetical protein